MSGRYGVRPGAHQRGGRSDWAVRLGAGPAITLTAVGAALAHFIGTVHAADHVCSPTIPSTVRWFCVWNCSQIPSDAGP